MTPLSVTCLPRTEWQSFLAHIEEVGSAKPLTPAQLRFLPIAERLEQQNAALAVAKFARSTKAITEQQEQSA